MLSHMSPSVLLLWAQFAHHLMPARSRTRSRIIVATRTKTNPLKYNDMAVWPAINLSSRFNLNLARNPEFADITFPWCIKCS